MVAAKIEETVCEDMISALPDDLLVTILLLVPVKDAVATMILSKRWRFVWTMLPILEYEENGDGHDRSFSGYDKGDDDDDDKSKKSIWCFFEKSMELHKAPVLEILLIKLGAACPIDADVGKCLIKAVDRRVAVIKLKLCWSTGPTRLPKSLYTCETLYNLTLSHKILVDFPSSGCLPSLFKLKLFYVEYKDEASLVSLLSSCPLLGILRVKRDGIHDNVSKFIVKVPSLEYFSYDNIDCSLLLTNNDVVDTGRCLVIDTPGLTHLDIIDYSREPWSMENMHCLEMADITATSLPDIDKSKTSLRGVTSIMLFMTKEVHARCSSVNFSRLIKLEICPYDSDWLEPLLLLLENTPKLKHLLVNHEYHLIPNAYHIPLSWRQPSSTPGCISSHLKIFKYREYGDREEEEEFLTYILANSICLKTVTISVRPTFDPEKKKFIIEKLRNIPRVSTTSQLLFK